MCCSPQRGHKKSKIKKDATPTRVLQSVYEISETEWEDEVRLHRKRKWMCEGKMGIFLIRKGFTGFLSEMVTVFSGAWKIDGFIKF